MLICKVLGNRILIVSRDVTLKQDGGTLVSKRNERLLQNLGFKTERFIIPIPSLITRLTNIIFHQSYGSTKSLLNKFKNTINQKFDYVFFDGSIYGGYLKIASDFGCKTICFYHNVEVEYYKQKAIQTKSFVDKLMVPYIRYNERLSTEYSNGRIALNSRDANLLYKQYGKGVDVIIPTSMQNRNIESLYAVQRERKENTPYLLFVGTNFFANIEGLIRFIEKVAPKINYKVIVVGNINEAFSSVYEIPDNVEFVGRVDSLKDYYLNASAVIAPIFSGSGLKTKTVEAISYGKTVIGFSEAFEGIDFKQYSGSCIQVKNDEEFISAINNINQSSLYNQMSAKLFHDKLSDDAQLGLLQSFINSL